MTIHLSTLEDESEVLLEETYSDGWFPLLACGQSLVEVDSRGLSARKHLTASDTGWKAKQQFSQCSVHHGPLSLAEDTVNFLELIERCTLHLSTERYDIFRYLEAVTLKDDIYVCSGGGKTNRQEG